MRGSVHRCEEERGRDWKGGVFHFVSDGGSFPFRAFPFLAQGRRGGERKAEEPEKL